MSTGEPSKRAELLKLRSASSRWSISLQCVNTMQSLVIHCSVAYLAKL